jgi:caa(3)-type oxidase subunit IV
MNAAGSGAGIGKYLPVYFVLIAIFGVEVFLSFRNFSTGTLVVILLLLAICSASLGLMYFMHLAQERRSLFLSLIPATIFVLLMMNMIWTDSVRLLHMRPFAQ